MNRIILSSLFLINTVFAVAQTDTTDYYSSSKPKLSMKDRVSTCISMGTGVSFLNTTKSAGIITFVAPKIGYQFTPKFKMNLGLMHYSITGNTFMPISSNEALFNTGNKTTNGNLVFAEGQYLIKSRLLLSSAVMADMTNSQQNNFKAASVGIEYKTSEHTSIKFQTMISNGQGNYYNNPTLLPGSAFSTFGSGFSGGNSVFR